MFTSVSVFFIVLSLRTVKSDDPVYGAVGDEVVLKPGPVQGPITEIMWKHGQDLAMEWYQGSVEAFRQFKERGSLNVTTGALTITGLTPGDSGSYTAEINIKVASTTQLLVISRVSKPTVSTQCDADNTYCVFTCESNDTTAEPVTYSWMAEEKSWTSTKEINITKDESEKQFYCELSNPVSTELSEPVDNPFRTYDPVYGAVGDEVVLKPGPVQGPITDILEAWKHGQDLAMEWYQGSVEAFRQFKDAFRELQRRLSV